MDNSHNLGLVLEKIIILTKLLKKNIIYKPTNIRYVLMLKNKLNKSNK